MLLTYMKFNHLLFLCFSLMYISLSDTLLLPIVHILQALHTENFSFIVTQFPANLPLSNPFLFCGLSFLLLHAFINIFLVLNYYFHQYYSTLSYRTSNASTTTCFLYANANGIWGNVTNINNVYI